jgi:hypothetical protein
MEVTASKGGAGDPILGKVMGFSGFVSIGAPPELIVNN